MLMTTERTDGTTDFGNFLTFCLFSINKQCVMSRETVFSMNHERTDHNVIILLITDTAYRHASSYEFYKFHQWDFTKRFALISDTKQFF